MYKVNGNIIKSLTNDEYLVLNYTDFNSSYSTMSIYGNIVPNASRSMEFVNYFYDRNEFCYDHKNRITKYVPNSRHQLFLECIIEICRIPYDADLPIYQVYDRLERERQTRLLYINEFLIQDLSELVDML